MFLVGEGSKQGVVSSISTDQLKNSKIIVKAQLVNCRCYENYHRSPKKNLRLHYGTHKHTQILMTDLDPGNALGFVQLILKYVTTLAY